MRKQKVLVAFLVMLLALTNSNTEFTKASGDQYFYREAEVADGNGTTIRKVWVKNGEVLNGNPDAMEQQSNVNIEVTPDESCAAYLAEFSEPTVRVRVNPGVEVTFGSVETPTSIQWLTCDNATVTVYAEDGDYAENGSLPGSVYGVTTYNSTIDFHGNIQYLYLGDERQTNESDVNAGTVTVTGKVRTLEWYKTTQYNEGTQGTVYYNGFTGNVTVSGQVYIFAIKEIKHSNILNADLKAETGMGFELPSFTMTDGELSDDIQNSVTPIEQDMETFYFELTPQNGAEGLEWYRVARYPNGAETGVAGEITDEEAKEIISGGTARINMSRDESVVADLNGYSVSELKVYRGGITVDDVTTEDENGLLQIHSYGTETITVKATGDVDRCTVKFTRYNPNMNIDVDGPIKEGHIFKSSLQSDYPIDLGSFSCMDMPLVINGIWNPALFLSLGTAEYHPVDDYILDDLLGLVKNVPQNDGEISEMADMVVSEMASGILSGLENDSLFQAAVNGYENIKVLTGVDIEISTYDYNETTGEISNKQEVTELGDDKELDFTIKVPENQYDENKKYVIVREHENKSGDKEMEVLIPERNGDKLTFKTNKFSSFTIVETTSDMTGDDMTECEHSYGDWEVTKEPSASEAGVATKTCSACGDEETKEIAYLKLASFALVLEDNLTMRFWANSGYFEDGYYENPRMQFSFGGNEYTVSDYTIAADGRYVFEFTNIAPHKLNEVVSFSLCADFNGQSFEGKNYERSIVSYCTTELNNMTEQTELGTLLVDLLNYGAAAQIYANHDTGNLANEGLTETQKAWGTAESTACENITTSKYEVIDNPTVSWKSVSLYLENTISIRYIIQADSLDGVTMKLYTDSGKTWTISNDDFIVKPDTENQYYVYFNGLNAGEMREPVYATMYQGNTAISNTLRYSIGSYVAYSETSSSDDELLDMLAAMMKYGDAAYEYAN